MKCIYLRTNLVNGKQYVGQTVNFEQREKDWKYDSYYSGGVIDKARNKYGIENFKVEVLRDCETQDELNEWEMYYIKELNTKVPNGYNLTDGGGGMSGFKHSKESIEKAVEAWKKSYNPLNHILSEEQRRKISAAVKGKLSKEKHPNWGKHRSEETKKKISQKLKGENHWLYGEHHSDKTKNKMSETHNREDVKERNILNQPTRKDVYQYKSGVFIDKYISANQAAKAVGTTQGLISKCCNGGYFDKARGKWHNIKTVKGYEFSYEPL